MRIGPLRKIIDTNVDLRTEVNRAYVIRAWGTTDGGWQQLYIDGKYVGKVRSDVAPLRRTNNNLWGPLELGEDFLVIPPLYVFRTVGAANQRVILIGDLYVLDPGESLPGDLLTRFAAQASRYKEMEVATYSHGTNVAFANNQEVTVARFTAPSRERWIFNDRIGIAFSNVTIGDGSVGVRLFIEGVPVDQLIPGSGRFGIDAMQMPFPPRIDNTMSYVTLRDHPIVLEPNQTLEVRIINTSGADIVPTSGTSMTVTFGISRVVEKVG